MIVTNVNMLKFIILSVILFEVVVIAEKLVNYTDINVRTFGGHDLAHIKKAPHQVSVHYCEKYVCGGTIIAKNWIITAARCVRGPQNCYTIRAGSLHHDGDGSIHSVEKIIIHEHFNIEPNGFSVNDIALILLSVPISIDASRRSISLVNTNGAILPGAHVTMYGWGNTAVGSHSTLRMIKSKALDKIKCNTTYKKYGGIYDNQGCAGDLHGKTSLHINDAGGPIVHKTRLFGILSWTDGCGDLKYPIIYTEVAAYRFWIRRHTGVGFT